MEELISPLCGNLDVTIDKYSSLLLILGEFTSTLMNKRNAKIGQSI